MEHVLVTGERPEDYKIQNPNLSKLSEPLLYTPQSIVAISEAELKDRAVSNLNDALRSVASISIGAGEFRSLGNSPTIRGFVARTDMFMDGMRDFGSYYRDPFNDEAIEVLEGPASVLFGRGSTGGVINQVSKLPKLESFTRLSVVGGTDLTRRATLDINRPLADLGEGAAFRITAMGHAQEVTGRDVVESARYGFSPSLALGLGTPTRLTASYYHLREDDIPDYGLPYYGADPAPVPRENFYGFKSDYFKASADIGTLKAEHDFSDAFSVQNQLRYAYYMRDFRFTEPLGPATTATPPASVMVQRNDETGRAWESMLWDQAQATARFSTGFIQHTLIAGVEGGSERAKDEFYNNTGVPDAALLNPDTDLVFNGTTFPRVFVRNTVNSFSVWGIDTLKIGEQWELTGALRWDSFSTDYHDTRYSTTAPFGTVTGGNDITRSDSAPSYRGAVTYKPLPNGSLYFAYGTSFNSSSDELSFIVSSRNFNISNAFLDPEENQTFELGSKWEVLDGRVRLTGALFRLEKKNARIPNPTSPSLNTLGGDQRVDGFELTAAGRITPDWQVTAGYTYLDSQVTKSGPGAAPVGSVLMNTPKNALTFWTDYRLGDFTLGGGGQYVSDRTTQNVPPLKFAPGYWLFNAMVKYDVSERISLQLNVNNLFDTYYYEQLHFFHIVPGEGRTALLTLNMDY